VEKGFEDYIFALSYLTPQAYPRRMRRLERFVLRRPPD